MNLNDIVRQVNRDIDDQYDLDDVKDWVNRCLDDLTPVAKRETLALTDVDPSNAYELPPDLYQLAFVRVNDEKYESIFLNNDGGKGYKVWENTLYLQPAPGTGQLELYYYRTLGHVEIGADIPDLEPEFHDLLVMYCLGNIQFHDEDYELRPDSFSRYNARKQEYIRFTQKKNRRKRVTEKVIW
jgi:hypothetical protein